MGELIIASGQADPGAGAIGDILFVGVVIMVVIGLIYDKIRDHGSGS